MRQFRYRILFLDFNNMNKLLITLLSAAALSTPLLSSGQTAAPATPAAPSMTPSAAPATDATPAKPAKKAKKHKKHKSKKAKAQ